MILIKIVFLCNVKYMYHLFRGSMQNTMHNRLYNAKRFKVVHCDLEEMRSGTSEAISKFCI